MQALVEAKRRGHSDVGPEHLFLVLVRDAECGAARILVALGVDLADVRRTLEFMPGQSAPSTGRWRGLTPQAHRVIQQAHEEAWSMRHSAVGTEHLLLGLAREDDGIAAGVLASLGVDVETARAATRTARGHPSHSLDDNDIS